MRFGSTCGTLVNCIVLGRMVGASTHLEWDAHLPTIRVEEAPIAVGAPGADVGAFKSLGCAGLEVVVGATQTDCAEGGGRCLASALGKNLPNRVVHLRYSVG